MRGILGRHRELSRFDWFTTALPCRRSLRAAAELTGGAQTTSITLTQTQRKLWSSLSQSRRIHVLASTMSSAAVEKVPAASDDGAVAGNPVAGPEFSEAPPPAEKRRKTSDAAAAGDAAASAGSSAESDRVDEDASLRESTEGGATSSASAKSTEFSRFQKRYLGEDPSELAGVPAVMCYLADETEPSILRNGKVGTRRALDGNDTPNFGEVLHMQDVWIHNARLAKAPPSLDVEGFALCADTMSEAELKQLDFLDFRQVVERYSVLVFRHVVGFLDFWQCPCGFGVVL